jgi:hypothetical protein
MMADKQGLLGARSAEDADDARPATDAFGAAVDEREAYEEDWYRSLRALAERQALLAEPEEAEDAELTADRASGAGTVRGAGGARARLPSKDRGPEADAGDVAGAGR